MAEFISVKGRKQKKCHSLEFDANKFHRRVSEIVADIRMTNFFKEFQGLVKTAVGKDMKLEIVCLGLGNFIESYIARYQLALLVALREDLEMLVQTCEVYDPQFTPEETVFLTQLGMTVPEQNLEGKRIARTGVNTLFYLPHCGKALYNNILWANWGPQLAHLIIIGNSFSAMMERTPARILENTASFVIKILPHTKEQPFTVPEKYEDVFSDTSIHSFPMQHLQEVNREFWENCSEPVYDQEDVEIILSNNSKVTT